jgi:hypothetical protein
VRFVLVANNPRADLSGIRPDDAVLQFNHCTLYEKLKAHTGPRVYAFMLNHNGTVSGWAANAPDRDYTADLCVVVGHSIRVEYECEWRGWPYRGIGANVSPYPRGKVPTAGFAVLTRLVRMKVPVALCGWTNSGTWAGHAWGFEREWCDAHKIERI